MLISKWEILRFLPKLYFLIPITLQPNAVDIRYFKLKILLDQIALDLIIKGVNNQVANI